MRVGEADVMRVQRSLERRYIALRPKNRRTNFRFTGHHCCTQYFEPLNQRGCLTASRLFIYIHDNYCKESAAQSPRTQLSSMAMPLWDTTENDVNDQAPALSLCKLQVAFLAN